MRNKVLIVPISRKTVTEGGIHLPDSAQRPEIIGRVLECGPDCPDWLKDRQGKLVLFKQFAGVELLLEDDSGKPLSILAMDYEQIIGIVEEEVD